MTPDEADAAYYAGQITYEQLRAEYTKYYTTHDDAPTGVTIEVIGGGGQKFTIPAFVWAAAGAIILYSVLNEKRI